MPIISRWSHFALSLGGPKLKTPRVFAFALTSPGQGSGQSGLGGAGVGMVGLQVTTKHHDVHDHWHLWQCHKSPVYDKSYLDWRISSICYNQPVSRVIVHKHAHQSYHHSKLPKTFEPFLHLFLLDIRQEGLGTLLYLERIVAFVNAKLVNSSNLSIKHIQLFLHWRLFLLWFPHLLNTHR